MVHPINYFNQSAIPINQLVNESNIQPVNKYFPPRKYIVHPIFFPFHFRYSKGILKSVKMTPNGTKMEIFCHFLPNLFHFF